MARPSHAPAFTAWLQTRLQRCATRPVDGQHTMSGGNWKEMFSAACDGDLDLLDYHVKAGADINYAHPEFLATALVASILAKQEDAALYLLSHGANPHLLSEFDGLTPAQAALQTGLVRVQRRLQELGATPAEPPQAPQRWWSRLTGP